MFRFVVGIGVAAAALLATASAFAADMPVKAPVAPVAPVLVPVLAPLSWTGFYIGANGGGGWSRTGFDYVSNDPASGQLFAAAAGGQPPSGSIHTSGWLAGLQLGYNWQFDRQWLIGIETDFDFANVRGETIGSAQASVGHPVTATLGERMKYFSTLRARLGFLPMDNLLVFATGGLAYAKIDHDADYTMTAGLPIGSNLPPGSFICVAGTSCFNGENNSWVAGWAVGGGLEYAFAAHWSIKAEYLHASFATKPVTETAASPFPGSACCSTINVNHSRTGLDVARLGINWKF